MNDDASARVAGYLQRFPSEAGRLEPLLAQLARNDDVYSRRTGPGHVTASGIVITDSRVLLVKHPILQKWIQPGGHLESAETPPEAALREVFEETGIAAELHPWHHDHVGPLDIDVHAIPMNPAKGEPAHWHFDFRYLLGTDDLDLHGEHTAAWVAPDAVEEPNLRALLDKVARLRVLAGA